MRVLWLTAFVAVANAKSNSLECYAEDGNGNRQYDYNGDVVLEICECDSSELAQFVGHIGNECFEGGRIPAEVWEGFYSGCPNYNNNNGNDNNNNNNGYYCQENEGDEAKFWCTCFGKYLNRYGDFPSGCWIPEISNAMREIGGQSMESAWAVMGCEWFDYQASRILPEDVTIAFGPVGDDGKSSGSFSVTTDEYSWRSVVSLDFNYEDLQDAYLKTTGMNVQCNANNNNGRRRLDEHMYARANGRRRLDDDDNQNMYGPNLAIEIRDGWNYADSATRYGAACSQDYTGDVFVSKYYPQSYDDNGYVEDVEDAAIFIGDLSEAGANPLVVNYGGQVMYGNQQNYNGNNNNNNNNNDGSGEEMLSGMGGAFAYSLYGKNDVDTYSVVISCGDDVMDSDDGNNNNNGNYYQAEDECLEFDGDERACASRTSRYAIPLMCANFAVMFSEEKSDDIPDWNDNFEEDEEGDNQQAEQNGMAEWREAEIRQELEGTGLALTTDAVNTGKTVGLVLLSLLVLGLCVWGFKNKTSGPYDKVPETATPNDNTPLAGQQL